MRQASWKPGQAGVVCGVVLFQVVFGAALAQSADAPAAAAAPLAADAAKDPGPFGGCEPIGMTGSGELVFPLECKHKITLPTAPVASEEPAPVAADKPAVAETKPAVSDDKPATTSENNAVEDKPAADTKAAAVEDKPAAAAKQAAAPETLTATDKAPAADEHKSVEAKPAEPAVGTAAPAQTATGKATMAKTVSEMPAKHAGRHATKVASVAKQIVTTAKPVQGSVVLAHAAAEVQTAGTPSCTHFRSYNAATKSYLGFDGHKYACR